MNKDIFLTNNLSNKKEKFVPLNEKKIGMYVCGPTVYDNPHIGNARPLVIFDILFKVLKFKYGKKSFFKHLHAGRIKGLITTVLPLDSIRFDVDTSTDLSRLFMQNPQIKSEVL